MFIDGFSVYYNSSRHMLVTRSLLVCMWSMDNIYKDCSLLHFPFSYLLFSFSMFAPNVRLTFNPVDAPYSTVYLDFFLIHCHEWHCVTQLRHLCLSLGLSEELETVIFIHNI